MMISAAYLKLFFEINYVVFGSSKLILLCIYLLKNVSTLYEVFRIVASHLMLFDFNNSDCLFNITHGEMGCCRNCLNKSLCLSIYLSLLCSLANCETVDCAIDT